MSRKVKKFVSKVSRVVTPVVAVATGNPVLAALSLASNIKGPVGQIAGIAATFSNISSMLGGPTVDSLAGVNTAKLGAKFAGSIANSLGVASKTVSTALKAAQVGTTVADLGVAAHDLYKYKGATSTRTPLDVAASGAAGLTAATTMTVSGGQQPSLEQSGGRGPSGVGDAFRASEKQAPPGSSFGSVARRLGGFRDTAVSAYT